MAINVAFPAHVPIRRGTLFAIPEISLAGELKAFIELPSWHSFSPGYPIGHIILGGIRVDYSTNQLAIDYNIDLWIVSSMASAIVRKQTALGRLSSLTKNFIREERKDCRLDSRYASWLIAFVLHFLYRDWLGVKYTGQATKAGDLGYDSERKRRGRSGVE